MGVHLFLAVVRAGREARARAPQVALAPLGHPLCLVLLIAFVSARVRTVQSTMDVLFVISGGAVGTSPARRADAGAVAADAVAAALVRAQAAVAPGAIPPGRTRTQPLEALAVAGAVHHTRPRATVDSFVARVTLARGAFNAFSMAGTLLGTNAGAAVYTSEPRLTPTEGHMACSMAAAGVGAHGHRAVHP